MPGKRVRKHLKQAKLVTNICNPTQSQITKLNFHKAEMFLHKIAIEDTHQNINLERVNPRKIQANPTKVVPRIKQSTMYVILLTKSLLVLFIL